MPFALTLQGWNKLQKYKEPKKQEELKEKEVKHREIAVKREKIT